MKPAGRERDFYIGKLKGIVVGFYEEDIDIDNTSVLEWSTSWNDAKELWDELPKTKEYEEGKDGENVLYFRNKQGLVIKVSGKDFPDAISQAWIKWKEKNE